MGAPVHDVEAGECRQTAGDQATRHVHIVVDGNVHVAPQPERRLVEAGVGAVAAGQGGAPRHPHRSAYPKSEAAPARASSTSGCCQRPKVTEASTHPRSSQRLTPEISSTELSCAGRMYMRLMTQR